MRVSCLILWPYLLPFFVDRGSGNEKGLLEGKKSNELGLKTDSGNDMGK